jgi:hypothetical protein
MNTIKKSSFWSVSFAGLVVSFTACFSVHAESVLPGNVNLPLTTRGTSLPSGSVIASESFAVSASTALLHFTGTVTIQVYKESASKTLDFLYQLSNNASSNTSIKTLKMDTFTGFTTNVDNQAGTTGIAATLVDRSYNYQDTAPNGAQIEFYVFGTTSPHGILPGMQSMVLYIQTNATTYSSNGTFYGQDGVKFSISNTYGPGGTLLTPEPTSLMIFGICAGGVVGGGWCRRRQFLNRG